MHAGLVKVEPGGAMQLVSRVALVPTVTAPLADMDETEDDSATVQKISETDAVASGRWRRPAAPRRRSSSSAT